MCSATGNVIDLYRSLLRGIPHLPSHVHLSICIYGMFALVGWCFPQNGCGWGNLTRRGSATWPVWGFLSEVTGTSPVHVAHVVPNHANLLGATYSSYKQVPIVACAPVKADAVRGMPAHTEVALTLTAPTPPRTGCSPTMCGSVPGESPQWHSLLSSIESDRDIPGLPRGQWDSGDLASEGVVGDVFEGLCWNVGVGSFRPFSPQLAGLWQRAAGPAQTRSCAQ